MGMFTIREARVSYYFYIHVYYTRNETKVAQPEFVDITGLMVNEH